MKMNTIRMVHYLLILRGSFRKELIAALGTLTGTTKK
jgi:hypothetical protein